MVSLPTMDFPMIKRASCSRMPYSSTAPASPPEIAKKKRPFHPKDCDDDQKDKTEFQYQNVHFKSPIPIIYLPPHKGGGAGPRIRAGKRRYPQPPYPPNRTQSGCHDSHSIMTAVFSTTSFLFTVSGPKASYEACPCADHVSESLRVRLPA